MSFVLTSTLPSFASLFFSCRESEVLFDQAGFALRSIEDQSVILEEHAVFEVSEMAKRAVFAELSRRFPAQMRVLERAGVHPKQTEDFVDPINNQTVPESFSNVGWHCLFVAKGVDNLCRALEEQGKLTREQRDMITARAMLHDANKALEALISGKGLGYELLRRLKTSSPELFEDPDSLKLRDEKLLEELLEIVKKSIKNTERNISGKESIYDEHDWRRQLMDDLCPLIGKYSALDCDSRIKILETIRDSKYPLLMRQAYKPASYRYIAGMLKEDDSATSSYLEAAGEHGSECGHTSLSYFSSWFLYEADNAAIPNEDLELLAQVMVHLVDDMTYTGRGSNPRIFYLPPWERMLAAGFIPGTVEGIKGYPFMLKEGLGRKHNGNGRYQVVDLEDIETPESGVEVLGSYMYLQPEIAENMCYYIHQLSGLSLDLDSVKVCQCLMAGHRPWTV